MRKAQRLEEEGEAVTALSRPPAAHIEADRQLATRGLALQPQPAVVVEADHLPGRLVRHPRVELVQPLVLGGQGGRHELGAAENKIVVLMREEI